MKKTFYILIIFASILLPSCTKVYTGYKFDNFNLEDIKLLSSKDEIINKIGKATVTTDYSFDLNLKKKNLEEQKMLNCENKNCIYYINSEGYDFMFLRNILQKYKILILKFNQNNKLIEKYLIEN